VTIKDDDGATGDGRRWSETGATPRRVCANELVDGERLGAGSKQRLTLQSEPQAAMPRLASLKWRENDDDGVDDGEVRHHAESA
jgi:hypothetical protein